MYHCNEILYYAYPSADEFSAAIKGYPFKGGLVKDLDLDALDWQPVKNTLRITTDRLCPLRDAKFQDFVFTHQAKVLIGQFPSGNNNYITLYYSAA